MVVPYLPFVVALAPRLLQEPGRGVLLQAARELDGLQPKQII